MNEDGVACWIAFALFVGFVIGSFFLGDGIASTRYQNEAIERGYAEHDRVTGEWKWIEPEGQADEQR